MRRKCGVIFGVIGYIVFFFCIEGWGAKWEPFAETVDFQASYDSENLTQTQDIIRVWVKYIYTEKGIIDKVGDVAKSMRI